MINAGSRASENKCSGQVSKIETTRSGYWRTGHTPEERHDLYRRLLLRVESRARRRLEALRDLWGGTKRLCFGHHADGWQRQTTKNETRNKEWGRNRRDAFSTKANKAIMSVAPIANRNRVPPPPVTMSRTRRRTPKPILSADITRLWLSLVISELMHYSYLIDT